MTTTMQRPVGGQPVLPILGECKHCYARTYPEKPWLQLTLAERAASGAVQAAPGSAGTVCERCHNRPEDKRDPEPGADLVEPQCHGCERYMVTRVHWRKASYAERDELKDEGYVVASNDDWCRACRPKEER